MPCQVIINPLAMHGNVRNGLVMGTETIIVMIIGQHTIIVWMVQQDRSGMIVDCRVAFVHQVSITQFKC